MSEREEQDELEAAAPELAAEQRPAAGAEAGGAELERHGNVEMENAALRAEREPDRANRDVRP